MDILGTTRQPNATADPSSPAAGQTYYNATAGLVRMYNGSSWVTLFTVPAGTLDWATPTLVANGTHTWRDAAFTMPGIRLFLTSGTPFPVSDETAKSTIYVGGWMSDVCPVISETTGGLQWLGINGGAGSLALSGLTSGKNYDVAMVQNLSNNLAANPILLPAWTNDSTRAAAISLVSGLWTNSGSFTDPISSRVVPSGCATIIGTIRTTGTTTTENSAAKRFVSNLYWPVEMEMVKTVTSGGHTYASNPVTIRDWNADNTNRFEFVQCVAGRRVPVQITAVSAGAGGAQVRFNMDGSGSGGAARNLNNASAVQSTGPQVCYAPAAGYHYVQASETNETAASTATFYDFDLRGRGWF